MDEITRLAIIGWSQERERLMEELRLAEARADKAEAKTAEEGARADKEKARADKAEAKAEKEINRRKCAEKHVRKLKVKLTQKEEGGEEDSARETREEEEGREPLDWKVTLTESCLNQLKENTEAREGDEEELLSILNNPTFTILQDEEGVIPSPSPLGEGVMKKCRVYPRIKKSSGTGYLRWVVKDITYYLPSDEGILYSKTDKITEKRKTRSSTRLDHLTWKGKGRFAKALYYGLEDLINQRD